mmetsp:Transcript_6452/g.15682  ORF Transcript_6452/g.15682 Transcript_6452/m.15682 type:complete len:354 (+) Transcript_6452:117-1178(+)
MASWDGWSAGGCWGSQSEAAAWNDGSQASMHTWHEQQAPSWQSQKGCGGWNDHTAPAWQAENGCWQKGCMNGPWTGGQPNAATPAWGSSQASIPPVPQAPAAWQPPMSTPPPPQGNAGGESCRPPPMSCGSIMGTNLHPAWQVAEPTLAQQQLAGGADPSSGSQMGVSCSTAPEQGTPPQWPFMGMDAAHGVPGAEEQQALLAAACLGLPTESVAEQLQERSAVAAPGMVAALADAQAAALLQGLVNSAGAQQSAPAAVPAKAAAGAAAVPTTEDLPSYAMRVIPQSRAGGGAFFLKSEKRDWSSTGKGGGFYERQDASERVEHNSDDEMYDEFGRKKKRRKPEATKARAAKR